MERSRKLVSDTSSCLLAIDAGNTRIKWGVHAGEEWRATGSIGTAQSAALFEALRPHFPVDAAIASNVAGPQVLANLEATCREGGVLSKCELISTRRTQFTRANRSLIFGASRE